MIDTIISAYTSLNWDGRIVLEGIIARSNFSMWYVFTR